MTRTTTKETTQAAGYETVPIGSIRNDPHNVRRHSKKSIRAIRMSLRKFKQQKPLVVDADGIVLAGNGTLIAMQQEGYNTVDVFRTSLKGAAARAFAIADNRIGDLSVFDYDALSAALEQLSTDATHLGGLGFTEAELDKLLKMNVAFAPMTPPRQTGLEFRIIIECNDEAHQTKLLGKLEDEGLSCRALIS